MSIGLLIFLPVLSKFFGLNDTIVLTLCGVLDGSGNLYVCVYKVLIIYSTVMCIDFFSNF